MADVSINALPEATAVSDNGLLVIYQNDVTQSVTGQLVKNYAATAATEIASPIAASAVENKFEGMAVNASTLPAGSQATATYNADTNTLFIGIPKGADGQGAGDMTKAEYDSSGAVANAGGIAGYVAANAGLNEIGTSTDTSITGLLKGSGGKVAAASAGTDYATPSQVGAKITDPSAKAAGQVLTYNGASWEAQTPASGGMTGTLHNVTFTTALWDTTSDGYKSQSISVNGVKADYAVPPQIDVLISGGDLAADKAIVAAFALVLYAETGANSLTLYASDTPEVNFTVQLVTWE